MKLKILDLIVLIYFVLFGLLAGGAIIWSFVFNWDLWVIDFTWGEFAIASWLLLSGCAALYLAFIIRKLGRK